MAARLEDPQRRKDAKMQKKVRLFNTLISALNIRLLRIFPSNGTFLVYEHI